MSRLRVGRVRKKMATMLREHGLVIAPEFIDTQEGSLCRNPGNDLARFFGRADWTPEKAKEHGWTGCHFYSWDRMSDCVRFGFVIRFKFDSICEAEISTNKSLEEYRREQKATKGRSA